MELATSVSAPGTSSARRPGGSLRRLVTPWLPAAAALLVVAAVLRRYGTPLPVTAYDALVVVATVTLPGMLVWRRVRPAALSLAEDLAVGTAVGLAAQAVLAYVLTPIGGPRVAWLWIVPAIAQSLTPRGRARCWARSTAQPVPRWSAWVQAGVVVLATVWLGVTSFAANPVAYADGRGPWSRGVPVSPYIDLPFQQAMTTAVDRGSPLTFPYMPGVAIHYHLFAYEHMAGLADVARIDATWLVYRLAPTVLLALAVVLVGALAHRCAGTPAAAPVAAAVTTFSTAGAVYAWGGTGSSGFLTYTSLRSPTHAFGMALLVAALLVAAVVLRGPGARRSVGLLLVFTLLTAAAVGGKGSTLPVVVGATLVVAALALVARSAVRAAALWLAAAAIVPALLVLKVVVGTEPDTTTIGPLAIVRFFVSRTGAGTGSLAPAAAVCLLGWAAAAAGALLLLRRDTVKDPVMWLLAGGTVAGLAAVLVADSGGVSQLYFLYACWPVLGVLSSWGLCSAFATRRLWVGAALVAWGAAATLLAHALVRPAQGAGFSGRAAAESWAVWAVAAAAAGFVAWWTARKRFPATWAVVGALCAVAVGTGLVVRTGDVVAGLRPFVTGAATVADGPPIAHDAALAALYVRDHAAAGDVVATNAHCYDPSQGCVPQHFWITALSQRRVLLEGWDYPGHPRATPYWDPALLTFNDGAFSSPTPQALARMRDEYGVRWLVVDRGAGHESPDLARMAQLVYEGPDAAVYRLG